MLLKWKESIKFSLECTTKKRIERHHDKDDMKQIKATKPLSDNIHLLS